MPEIKNTFLAGKMNKSLDDRLLPEGEYRDALNIQVTKSEGSDVGVVQNIKGNTNLSSELGYNLPSGFEVVGSFFDDQNNAIYWFVTNDEESYVLRYGDEQAISPPTTTTTTTTTAAPPTLTVVVSGNESPAESTQETYSTTIGGTATGLISYSWSVTNGTIVGSSTNSTVDILWPSVAANESGLVSVDISREGIDADDSLGVVIQDVPVSFGVQITENGSTTIDSDVLQQEVKTYGTQLSGTATGAVTYIWSVSGGTFTGQGTDSITVTWTTGGPGSVSVQATREGETRTDTEPVTVTALLTTVDITGDFTDAIENEVRTYGTVVNGNTTGDITYSWLVSKGTITGGSFVGGNSVIEGVGINSIEVTWGKDLTTLGTGSIYCQATRQGVSGEDSESVEVLPVYYVFISCSGGESVIDREGEVPELNQRYADYSVPETPEYYTYQEGIVYAQGDYTIVSMQPVMDGGSKTYGCPTTTTTTTTQAYQTVILYGSWSNSTDACAGSGSVLVKYIAWDDTLSANTIVYNNTDLNDPFNGGGLWYKNQAGTSSLSIASNGAINTVTAC